MEKNIQAFTITKENREAIGFTNNTEELVIPEFFVGNGKYGTVNGQTYQVTKIGSEAFFNCTKLEFVSMPDSVRKICEWSFQNCTSLKQILLSQNLEFMDVSAFCNCLELESIEFPRKINDCGCGGKYRNLFWHCPKLKTVHVDRNNPYFRTICEDQVLLDEDQNILWISQTSTELVVPETIAGLHSFLDLSIFDFNGTTVSIPTTVFIPHTIKNIDNGLFLNKENIRIIIDQPKDSIPGAPWGAPNAHIYWIG